MDFAGHVGLDTTAQIKTLRLSALGIALDLPIYLQFELAPRTGYAHSVLRLCLSTALLPQMLASVAQVNITMQVAAVLPALLKQ
jgi:hypothetical protein